MTNYYINLDKNIDLENALSLSIVLPSQAACKNKHDRCDLIHEQITLVNSSNPENKPVLWMNNKNVELLIWVISQKHFPV